MHMRRVALDTKRRTLVVGDIHGCLDELEMLLIEANFRVGRDRLVLCGDLIDRGPDSAGVVRLARELKAVSVLGNHEEKHLRYRRHEARAAKDKSYRNPMSMYHPEGQRGMSAEDWAYLESMPLAVDIGSDLTVVHGGFSKDSPRWRPTMASCRVRYVDAGTNCFRPSSDGLTQGMNTVFWTERYRGKKNVIYGHHVVTEAYKVHLPHGVWTLGLDTGCCFGRELTGYWVGTGELVSVPAIERPKHTREDWFAY